MSRGIYIVANDKVKENAIALINSIRYHDPDLPIFLIPFDDNYQSVYSVLQDHNVQLFPDLALVNEFTAKVGEIFDPSFLRLPNKMRKLVAWFGPLDNFLYIDTDIIVFQPLSKVLDYLADYQFVCCDYQYSGRGLKDVFSSVVTEQNLFNQQELEDVFNSGFWASRKDIISQSQMYELLQECSQHREYFDFSQNTTDQPLLNYLILKVTNKRLNLVKLPDKEPGSWAGSQHFIEKDHILYDGEKPLRYLHWAGTPLQPGTTYWSIWKHYRYLGDPNPPKDVIPPKEGQWRKFLKKVKSKFKK